MDIKQLQFLCALETHQHFGKAAESCFITQPTLSMRIRQLEEELGVSLIRRTQRFEGFTPEGERLLLWAKKTLHAFEGFKLEADRIKGELVGTLRIGAVPLSQIALMPWLKKMHAAAPKLSFQVSACSSESILSQLESNQLDIGISYLADLDHHSFNVHPLGRPGVGLLFHPKGQIAKALESYNALDATTPIPWSVISALPLGLLSNAMRFRQSLNRNAQIQGVSLTPLLETDSVEHLIEAAFEDLCATIIPLPLPSHPAIGELCVLPIEEVLQQPMLGLMARPLSEGGNAISHAFMQRISAES
jgi:DNA-binding transcriptional LysR family regulator